MAVSERGDVELVMELDGHRSWPTSTRSGEGQHV